MPLKVFIVDDEPDAIISVEIIIRDFCPDLQVVGKANTIDDAWDLIKETQPDLVFLDIEMPRGSGFDLLERFPIRKFDVIIITAHVRFKDKAHEYHSFYTLEKPIDIDLFLKTIQDLKQFRQNNPGKLYKKLPK
ncbi:MAG: response regulator [Bacteroidetes bacterium]|nr:response regulator [Bacteroidales bacterium]MBU1009881.1 response regulator [Bacteroidota bacterium]